MAPPPSWIILGNVARVSGTDAGADDLPLGADLALALAAPPRVTLLTVTQRVSPDPEEYPMILAVDPSGGGLLLLSTPPPSSPPSSPPPSSSASSSDGSDVEEVTLNITDVEEVTLNITDVAPLQSPPSSPRISDGEEEEDFEVTL